MEKLFMSRPAVIAWLIEIRRKTYEETAGAQSDLASSGAAALDRLILDVRAARVDTFELRHPRICQVVVASE